MTFPYELTYDEYVESQHATARETGATSHVPSLVGLGFFAIGFVLLAHERATGDIAAPLLLLALSLFTAIHPMHTWHSTIRRAWRAYQQSPPSYLLTTDDERLTWDSAQIRVEIPWPAFEHSLETRRLILLKHAAGDLIAIPKRAFPNPDALNEFRSLLQQKFPPTPKASP